jgi:hypothetical protein
MQPNTNWIFKAFQKNDKQVQIKIYNNRFNSPLFSTRELAEMTISNNDFYTIFVPNLNAGETELKYRRDTTRYIENPVIKQSPEYVVATLYGKWTCDEADKQRVMANIPANPNPMRQALLSDVHGGKRHKRSGKKRKSQTKCKSHKKSRRRH